MPKPEILDPQGKAIKGSLQRLGITQFSDIRQGKRFELTTPGEPSEADLDAARAAAEKLLSNPIIEDVTSVRVAS